MNVYRKQHTTSAFTCITYLGVDLVWDNTIIVYIFLVLKKHAGALTSD